jgi:hypothetical protein
VLRYATPGRHDLVVHIASHDGVTTMSTAVSVLVVEPQVQVELGFKVGERAGGAPVHVAGKSLVPGTQATITLHSAPTLLGEATVSADGTAQSTVELPQAIAPGLHHIEMSGTGQGGAGAVSQSWWFSVGTDGLVTNIASGPSSAAPSWSAASVTGTRYPPYSITAHAKDIVRQSQVALYTLLLALGGIGAAGFASQRLFNGEAASAAAGGTQQSERHKKKSQSVSSAKIKNLKSKTEGEAWGDASLTWRAPGFAVSDRLSLSWPVRVAPLSPLLGRTLNDGAYLRAMIGSLAWLSPIVGVVLGLVAVASSHGAAVPPALGLVLVIVVLGAFDALMGLCAATVFFIGVLVSGGLGAAVDWRVMLGLLLVFFAVPLVASATRPLRRAPSKELGAHFDRVADFVVAGLLSAWAIDKILGALPALGGQVYPVAKSAGVVALVALGAVVGRYGIETMATHLYPARLAASAPNKIPFSKPPQRLASTALKTLIFVFVAFAYLGNVWELWVGAALFILPAVVAIYENSLPNLPRLARVIPKGVVKVVLMLLVSKLAAEALISAVGSPTKLISLGIVFLALPGVILSLLGNFGREGTEWGINWTFRILGVLVVVAGLWLVLPSLH